MHKGNLKKLALKTVSGLTSNDRVQDGASEKNSGTLALGPVGRVMPSMSLLIFLVSVLALDSIVNVQRRE
jgi:hypothetical protein